MRLTGAQIIIKTLSDLGVDTVFGYPGGWIIDVYDALYRSRRIRHILTCHEQGAAHAADGYARKSGRVGVVMATSGPGGTNLVTGVAAAYMDSVALLVITCGVPPAIFGKDNFQEIDLFGVSMPITKHNFLVKDIRQIEPTLRRAYQIAGRGRPGPVWVDIHADLAAKVNYLGGGLLPQAAAQSPDYGTISAAAELINAAKRPVILAGGGVTVSKSGALLGELAAKIDAPVCLTSRALGALGKSDPLELGLLGMHGSARAAAALRDCDLLIALGTRFSDRTVGKKSGFAPDAAVIHIDVDAAEIGKIIPADVGITCDLAAALPALIAAVAKNKHTEWRERLAAVENPAADERTGPGVGPGQILTALQQALPDACIATDVGQHQIWVWQYCKFSAPDKLLTSCGLGAMGFGLGAAIGAKIASPDEATVLVTGDASFHMNMAELATAVTERLPLLVLVIDNHALGMVRQWQKLFFGRRYSQTQPLRRTDFVRLARAMGASGLELDTAKDMAGQFAAASELARKRRRPVLLHCAISPEWSVLPIRRQGGEDNELIQKIDIQGV